LHIALQIFATIHYTSFSALTLLVRHGMLIQCL